MSSPARVGDDRAVAERPRAELHPALEPADDVALGDPLGDVREELPSSSRCGSKPAARSAASALVVGVLRPGVRVLHHEAARVAELLVPDVVRGADRDAGVARGRLDVDALESVSGRIRPFATAFSATPPARQRFVEPGAPVRRADEVEVRLLEHRLERGGDVLVVRFVSSVRGSRARPNACRSGREDAPDRRRLLVPRHVDAFLVVREVVELELEEVAVELDELAHRRR